ncbi:MAG TPA: RNA polymerase sigma factor [Candidatus Desulfobacillus sp.]|nr:RNA polymerase sigma factor [Candidatus Desulfobacillus sp.]
MQPQQSEAAAPIGKDTPESELVARAASGETAAFEAVMRRNNRLLFRTARSILKDDAEAEDALQEAYLRAWRALPDFCGQSRLSTWLVRIVANEALGRLRRSGAEVIPLEAAMMSSEPGDQDALTEKPDRGPEQALLREQLRKLVETRIDLLPDAYRTVFMLRAVEEMSVEEVAQALDIPEATVRSRFFRARGILREGLAAGADAALQEAFAFDGERCDRIVARTLAAASAAGLLKEG